MRSPVRAKPLALANLLLLPVVHAGSDAVVVEPQPEVTVTAVPEPSPILLLAGALAMLMLLFRNKGGRR
jgi:hypothetical protein